MNAALDAAIERLVRLGARFYLWPLRWLGIHERRRHALARALLALGTLSILLLPLTQVPLEWFLWFLLLPQRVPRLASALLSVGV